MNPVLPDFDSNKFLNSVLNIAQLTNLTSCNFQTTHLLMNQVVPMAPQIALGAVLQVETLEEVTQLVLGVHQVEGTLKSDQILWVVQQQQVALAK